MLVDPTPDQSDPNEREGVDREGPQSNDDHHWSPFSTTRAKWAWSLMAVFTVIYFAVAVLTSAEFAELAATETVIGLPLGFVLGIGLIVAGLVITRIYLSKVEG